MQALRRAGAALAEIQPTRHAFLAGDVAAIPLPGQGDAQAACNQALAAIGTLADKWTERKNVISGVVKTAG